jgi:threonine/homoserine/homoserine lactone efflux protein
VIPLALGAAVSPLVLVGAVAVMTGPGPLRHGCEFAAGVAIPLIVVTAACLLLGNAVSLPDASDATKGWIDVGLAAILFALGLLTLARPAKPAKQRTRPAGESGRRFVAMGAALMTTNVTTFALYIPAMKLIAQSSVSDVEQAIAISVVLAVTMTLVLVPLAVVAAAPKASASLLGRAGDWLASHHRAVTVGLCSCFGALLLIKGLAAL